MEVEPETELEPEQHDLLERARRAAQQAEPAGWVEVSATVLDRVRSALPAEPVLACSPVGSTVQDDAGSVTRVSSRVVRAALRRVLRRPTHAPVSIDLTVVDGRLIEVALELVCAYGVDLLALGDAVRAEVHDELVALLGPDPRLTPSSISVTVVDVVVGDPHLV